MQKQPPVRRRQARPFVFRQRISRVHWSLIITCRSAGGGGGFCEFLFPILGGLSLWPRFTQPFDEVFGDRNQILWAAIRAPLVHNGEHLFVGVADSAFAFFLGFDRGFDHFIIVSA